MKALIIDDEPACHEALQSIIAAQHPEIELVDAGFSVAEGLKLLETQRPDLLFLDIMLPDGTGFDILQQVNQHDFALIFTTGHNNFARQAIDFEAIAYLDKPVDQDLLADAITRAQRNYELRGMRQQLADLEHLLKNYLRQQLPDRLVITNSEGIHYLVLSDIRRLAVDEGLTSFYLSGNRRVNVSANLIKYERQLSGHSQFMRIHKSHLVNLTYVRAYDLNNAEVELDTGLRLPVGRKHREALRRRLSGEAGLTG